MFGNELSSLGIILLSCFVEDGHLNQYVLLWCNVCLQEAKILMAIVLPKFDFTLVEGEEITCLLPLLGIINWSLTFLIMIVTQIEETSSCS